ncbi:MAG: PAS domain-containing protein, partial [Candidatus Kapabacteria bacterium]|nr:PAS domain-containing protein [Candidatus Kapabacteria bacterium]
VLQAKQIATVSSDFQQWLAFSRTNHGNTSTSVVLCRLASPVTVMIGTVTQQQQFVIPGIDGVIHAAWIGGTWVCIGFRGDSLYAFSTAGTVQSPLLLAVGLRPDEIGKTVSNQTTLLIETPIEILSVQCLDGLLSLQRVAKKGRRSGVALVAKDTSGIVGYPVNDGMMSFEYLTEYNAGIIGVLPNVQGIAAASGTSLYSLCSRNGGYAVAHRNLQPHNGKEQQFILPAGLYEPLAMSVSDDTVVVLFANGLLVMDADGTILCDVRDVFDAFRQSPSIQHIGSQILVRSTHTAREYHLLQNASYISNRIWSLTRTYGLPLAVLLIFLVLLLRALRYRRYFSAAIEYGSNSIALLIDRNMKLRRINAKGRELFAMDTTTPLRRVLRFYCNEEYQRIIESFAANIVSSRMEQSQKLTLKTSSSEREIIFNGVPLRSLTGAFDGVLITGVDITDELEKKRLVNWAQLAHDMQTNLSIIKLNAEHLKSTVPDKYEDKRKRIQHQAELLLHRVRDIVSIGRDEHLNAVPTDVTTLFLEIAHEFDDPSFAHVHFMIQEQSCVANIDAKKMIRALRNAVENGIRALSGESGTIELRASVHHAILRISIRDTGRGMDEHTAENFLKPYFSNYRQYGGTGIGTMIMLRAAEIHKGTIEVESTLGSGTTIHFVIPQRSNARR